MCQDKSSEIVIKRSHRYAMSYIVTSIFLGLLSGLFLSRSVVFPSILVMLCAAGALVLGILMLKDQEAQLILDEQYIMVKKIGQIPWSKIRSARLEFRQRGLRLIILELIDCKSNRVRFQVHGLDMTPNEIYDLISSHVVAD